MVEGVATRGEGGGMTGQAVKTGQNAKMRKSQKTSTWKSHKTCKIANLFEVGRGSNKHDFKLLFKN